MFLYSAIELSYLSENSEYYILIYPVTIILIELSTIMAQRNIIYSLKTEESTGYKNLLREDLALIHSFSKLSNYVIERMSLVVGIKRVARLLDEAKEKYSILINCYIDENERLQTKKLSDDIAAAKPENITDICEAFTFLLTMLIDSYAALVPYDRVARELEDEIRSININIIKYFTPLLLFKIIIEPITRNLRSEELKKLRIAAEIEGIIITKKGTIHPYKTCVYESQTIQNKFNTLLKRLVMISNKEKEIKNEIRSKFRQFPENVKRVLYKDEFIKQLPSGILDEEKIVLMSKEDLIEELVSRKTKLEEAYARLSDAKLDKMKAEFVNIIAHELKTPLTSMKTYTDLLKKEKLGKLNSNQKQKLDQIAINIDKLTELIDDMLQIPTVDIKDLEIRKEIFEPKDVISEIITEVADLVKDKKQTIKIQYDKKISVIGDKNLIAKAFKNIIINAIKYSDKKDTIIISITANNEDAHITFHDTGKGIKTENLDKIFEPFFSLENGAGLGLSIAKNIISSHKGKIWAESSEGKGSSFHILLRME